MRSCFVCKKDVTQVNSRILYGRHCIACHLSHDVCGDCSLRLAGMGVLISSEKTHGHTVFDICPTREWLTAKRLEEV